MYQDVKKLKFSFLIFQKHKAIKILTKDVGKGNLRPTGKERSIQYFRNLASLTDRELHFRHHAVYHLKGRSYGEKKPIGKDKCKIKQNKVILKFVFLIFAFL